ncbi:hypothetical protein B0H12DRAFT_1136302 [Mycena haematopus]|nr:hypothetical protein B0H12DRAFT_1136302 [Mycena haematopus]
MMWCVRCSVFSRPILRATRLISERGIEGRASEGGTPGRSWDWVRARASLLVRG